MQPDSRKLLADVHEAAKDIAAFVKGKDIDDFANDELLRSGVYWKFAVIGEALSQLRKIDELTFDRITESWKILAFETRLFMDIR